MPDKAIKEEVTEEDIAAVVSRWTHIPVSKLLGSEIEKLLHLEEHLHQRVIGQEDAVRAVSEAVIRARSGLKDPNRPAVSDLGSAPPAPLEFLAKELAMPLRDHFRPPVEDRHSWDELHGMWPAVIVQQLFPLLPAGFVAAPGVHLGTAFEINVSTYEHDDRAPPEKTANGSGGVAVATWAPPQPTLTVETELPDQDEYEVRVYDARHGRRLVAAIEIVSPANKDRPESRRAFVAKVAALLQQDVSVSLVDLVTIRPFNLYADLLELIGSSDPALEPEPPALYAVTLRGRKQISKRPLLDVWFYPMPLGQALPALPLWLDIDLGLSLNLDTSYEESCRLLHIA